MTCPHCSTIVHVNFHSTNSIQTPSGDWGQYEILYGICPNCDRPIAYLLHGKSELGGREVRIMDPEWKKLIFPKESRLENTIDIPKVYLEDYEESLKVLASSPKASAALTRRLLQNILREEYKIKERTLSEEIEKFVTITGIPSHLTTAVDAIRQIGNFAAHPTKEKATGEIVPVEIGEAEWLVEVIESIFDFTFIQPKKLERRKQELNKKLEKIGKPKMK
jgi:hypothetical protein